MPVHSKRSRPIPCERHAELIDRRSFELESEILGLRQQLEERNAHAQSSPVAPSLSWDLPSARETNLPMPSHPDTDIAREANANVRGDPVAMQATKSTAAASIPSPDPTELLRAPGLTTKPGVDQPIESRRPPAPTPRPRALGNTALSVEEIEELFMMSAA